MIIHASVRSKGHKKGLKLKDKDLRDYVGALHLDATGPGDVALLTAMYGEVFGCLERNQKGSIKVFDKDGKEVIHYYYDDSPKPESATENQSEAAS